MKLTAKLVSAFLLGLVLLIGLKGYLAVRQEAEQFERQAESDARRIGTIVEQFLLAMRQRDQADDLLRMLRSMRTVTEGNQWLRIRWVHFDAPARDPRRPMIRAASRARLTQGSMKSFRVRDERGQGMLLTYWPLSSDAGTEGGIEFSRSLAPLDAATRRIIYRTLTELGATIAISGVLITVLGIRFVGQPLQTIIEKTRRVGAGDLSGPIHVSTRDELGELAENLNAMCQQLRVSQEKVREETASRIAVLEQLRHADRLRTVGRLASGVAHELGTPLNVVAGRADLIASQQLSADDVAGSARTIKAEARRMEAIIRQLLDFARRNTPQRAAVDVRQVLGQAVELLSGIANKAGVALRVADHPEPIVADVDTGQIQQVLSNLVVNAIQAMGQGGRVDLRIVQQSARPPDRPEDPPRQYAVIQVEDQGHGIQPEDREHLFEPFFTTKDVGDGTGLGLSIAYGIVVEHDGWIDVQSEPGRGSCFSVYLPKESPA